MNTILVTFTVVSVIVLIAVFLLSFRIWLLKDGKFPNIHIGGSKALKEKGVSCATSQDAEAQKLVRKIDVSKLLEEIDEN
ncbi:MAG: hypothetical protein ACK5KP_12425 [Paludibacteraceae bacterium]